MDIGSYMNIDFDSRTVIEDFDSGTELVKDGIAVGSLTENVPSHVEGIMNEGLVAEDPSSGCEEYIAMGSIAEDPPNRSVNNSHIGFVAEHTLNMGFVAEDAFSLGEENIGVGFVAEVPSSRSEVNRDVGCVAQHPPGRCEYNISMGSIEENLLSRAKDDLDVGNTAETLLSHGENNVEMGSPPSFCEEDVDLGLIAGNPSSCGEDNIGLPVIVENPHSHGEDDKDTGAMDENLPRGGNDSIVLGTVFENSPSRGEGDIGLGAVTKNLTPPSCSEDNIVLGVVAENIPSLGEDDIDVGAVSRNLPHCSEDNINVGFLSTNPPSDALDNVNAGSLTENSSSDVQGNITVAELACKNFMDSVGGVQKTELEREMELYEAAEREEQARLLASLRPDQSVDQSSQGITEISTGDTQGDRKRVLETVMPERRSKRGRKAQVNLWEDVCFVCFDGGELILCDRKSCPKAYHVDCTGRDSDFFDKKGAWFCGWHFCALCSRPATMHCYTCSTAVCNNCIKEADFLCIRKNKGLCDSCFPIVKMIEHGETVNADGVQVDFNDEETYEYLYKGYWEDLKNKVSLTWTELEKAQKAKEAGEQFVESSFNDSERVSSGTEFDDEPTTKRRRHLKRKRLSRASLADDESESDYIAEGDEDDEDDVKPKRGRMKARDFDGWASRELLDFLQLRKEDMKKPLPLMAVNKLLRSYIENNKLQHPRRRGQFICDEKLQKLFGKKNVGRFEMTKLLSSHLAPKQLNAGKVREVHATFDDDITEINHSEDKWVKGSNEKQRKAKRKLDESKYIKPDPNDFAAINVKNINLVYLRRALLEDLLDDSEFNSKAIGAFVRIRVPGMVNKNDACYRLVQVVGIKSLSDHVNAEKKMSDVVLEILNLQKREDVTIDLVSNQDFTEEECQRLRQCIKYGFIKAMTVGELEEKAKALQEVKVKDWFEAELLRLSHLRDRASEKGHKRELRECVEKLQLLSSPEEKERRLRAPLEITADPHMDPDFESDAEEKAAKENQGNVIEPHSSWEKGHGTRSWSIGITEKLSNQWESSSLNEANMMSATWDNAKAKSSGWGQKDFGRDREVDFSDKKSNNWLQALSLEDTNNSKRESENMGWENDLGRNREREVGWNNQSSFVKRDGTGDRGIDKIENTFKLDGRTNYGRVEAYSGTPLPDTLSVEWRGKRDEITRAASTVTLPSTGMAAGAAGMNSPQAAVDEKEKIWHYQDPTGKIQGPFSMEQLRKWEKTKLFPLDLKVWKTSEHQDEAILLTDALAGKFSKILPPASLPQSAVATENYPQTGWGGMAFGRDLRGAPVASVPGNDWRERAGTGGWDQNGTAKSSSTWNANNNGNITWGGGGWTTDKVQPSVGTKPDNTGWNVSVPNLEGNWGSHVAAESSGVVEEGWGPGKMPEPGSRDWSGFTTEGGAQGKGLPFRASWGRDPSHRDANQYRNDKLGFESRTARRKDIPCKFFARGMCKKGPGCEFKHTS